MPGGFWLNNAPSWGIINAMWVSLIKWHGDNLMCSPGGPKSPHSSQLPENVQAAPLVMWSLLIQHSSQDLNINLPLVSFPRSAVVSGMQACVSSEEEEEEEEFLYSCCGSIQPDSHYLQLQRRPESWRQPRDWKSASWSVYSYFLCNFPM